MGARPTPIGRMGDSGMQAPRTLSDLITRRIDPEAFARRQPSAEALFAPARPKLPDGPAAYESGVFNGVVGPGFSPVVAAEPRSMGVPVEYVILRASLEEAVRRPTTRAQPGAEEVVRHMHPAFEKLGEYVPRD